MLIICTRGLICVCSSPHQDALHFELKNHIKRSSGDCKKKTHPPIILKGKPKVRQSEGVSSATAVFCVTNGYSFDERGGDGWNTLTCLKNRGQWYLLESAGIQVVCEVLLLKIFSLDTIMGLVSKFSQFIITDINKIYIYIFTYFLCSSHRMRVSWVQRQWPGHSCPRGWWDHSRGWGLLSVFTLKHKVHAVAWKRHMVSSSQE